MCRVARRNGENKNKRTKIEDVVEEVLKCHSDENELLIALKSL